VATVENVIAIAESQIGKPYNNDGGNWNADDPDPPYFDCSEFTEWVCLRAGVPVRLAEASYLQYWQCQKLGREISVSAGIATRGSLLFSFRNTATGARVPPPKSWNDVPANFRGHVVFSLGGNRTIGAMNTNVGVARGTASTNSYDYAALVPGLDYGGGGGGGGTPLPPDQAAARFRPRPDKPKLVRGDNGPQVREAQDMLKIIGAPSFATTAPNGNFGPATQSAVDWFQSKVLAEQPDPKGMWKSGWIASVTWGWLYAYSGR
jgi:Putative peptidoglycan binding domain